MPFFSHTHCTIILAIVFLTRLLSPLYAQIGNNAVFDIMDEEKVALDALQRLSETLSLATERFNQRLDGFNSIVEAMPEKLRGVLEGVASKAIRDAASESRCTIDYAILSFQENFIDIRNSLRRAMLRIQSEGLENEKALIAILEESKFTPHFRNPHFCLGPERISVTTKDGVLQAMRFNEASEQGTITGYGLQCKDDSVLQKYKVSLVPRNGPAVDVPNGYRILGSQGQYRLVVTNLMSVIGPMFRPEKVWTSVRISHPDMDSIFDIYIHYVPEPPKLLVQEFTISAKCVGDDKDKKIEFYQYIGPRVNTAADKVTEVLTTGHQQHWPGDENVARVQGVLGALKPILASTLDQYYLVVDYHSVGDNDNEGPGVDVEFQIQAKLSNGDTVTVRTFEGTKRRLGDGGEYNSVVFPLTTAAK